MTIVQALQHDADVTPDFKKAAIKAGAFARSAVTNSYQYPGYMDIEDFQQEALLATLEAQKSFKPELNVPQEAWAVLKIKERMQALRRLAQKGHTTLFEQVMIDLLRPDELDALFEAESLKQESVSSKAETFLLVREFVKHLSPRQLKIFHFMYLGYSQLEISKHTGISQQTVSRDIKKIKTSFQEFCEVQELQDWKRAA